MKPNTQVELAYPLRMSPIKSLHCSKQAINKMDQSNIRMDHVSIVVEKLADSLRGKIDTLNQLSKDCCIYQVPPKVRMLNETLYTPKMVPIGPLQHGREELKDMQEHKLRYLEQFLKRTHVHMEEFLTSIKDRESDLCSCYLETINFGSDDEFVPLERDDTDTKRLDDSKVVPSVTKLHQAGVKIKLVTTTENLLDIRFNKGKGTLEIPKLTIGNMALQLLRNLHIFEGLHCDRTNYMNDYGVILNAF
ncbi:hypothetical protein EZV62_000221 [Acer yangbiense]|uniref:Uncharacterized protein n=1 Tax=Acer yangbiense TaxID=1000413 RepID=A0A5C7ITA5_9ROSI|nr:hypothetical protein EZV62_000221 [Acer yangbiense]